MSFQLTTLGQSALNGGAPVDESFTAEVRLGSSQSAPTIDANGIVTAPTGITPVAGAVPYPLTAVPNTTVPGLVLQFTAPTSQDPAGYTAYEAGIWNAAGVMVAYKSGGTTPLLTKVAGQGQIYTVGLVLTGVRNPNVSYAANVIQAATATREGLMRYANAAEADAGTADNRAMTPALVKRVVDAGSLSVDFQRFTSGGTWTKPDGATLVYVEMIGGGAAGDSGAQSDRYGGAPGSRVAKLFRASELGATESVVIGDGGRPGTTRGGFDGGATNTRFGTKLLARGARSHYNPGTTTLNPLTAAGTLVSALNRSLMLGYGGGIYVARTTPYSAAGSEEIGVEPGTAGTLGSQNGGNGGDSTLALGAGGGAGWGQAAGSSVGGNGGAPGGGGGAGRMRGGNGARGEVRVWTF